MILGEYNLAVGYEVNEDDDENKYLRIKRKEKIDEEHSKSVALDGQTS